MIWYLYSTIVLVPSMHILYTQCIPHRWYVYTIHGINKFCFVSCRNPWGEVDRSSVKITFINPPNCGDDKRLHWRSEQHRLIGLVSAGQMLVAVVYQQKRISCRPHIVCSIQKSPLQQDSTKFWQNSLVSTFHHIPPKQIFLHIFSGWVKTDKKWWSIFAGNCHPFTNYFMGFTTGTRRHRSPLMAGSPTMSPLLVTWGHGHGDLDRLRYW